MISRAQVGAAPHARRQRLLVLSSAACTVLAALTIVMPAAAQTTAPTPAPRPLSPPVPPRDAVPAPAGTGRIRGRVVLANDGQPLRRAQVTLTGEPNLRRQVTTDGDGRYEVSDLPAGRFTVSAGKGGFLTLQYGQRYAFESGRPATLAAGQTLTGVDIALRRAGVITGRVTDGRGEPVVGAEVRLERYQYGPDGQRRLNRAPLPAPIGTNDLGEFRAYGLMPGEYLISANVRQLPPRPGDATAAPGQRFVETYYPGVSSAVEAGSVVVGVGEQASASFTMANGRMTPVSGRIVDSAGRPGTRASLMLATPAANQLGASGMGFTAAADGTFSLPNVPPGEHFIQARLSPISGERGAEVANVPFSATGEPITGLQIITGAAASVVGRVQWDGRAPRTGSPTPLRIMTSPADGRPALVGTIGTTDPGADGTVGADDSFRVSSVIGAVRFTPSGVPPQWTLKAVMVNGVDATSSGTDASTLGSGTSLVVVLTDQVTEIAGTVVNRPSGNRASGIDDRAPGRVAEYVVVILPEQPVDAVVAARYTRVLRPDQSGAFRVRGLPAGRYAAVAVESLEQGTEWDPAFQQAAREIAQRFALTDGQTQTMTLELIR